MAKPPCVLLVCEEVRRRTSRNSDASTVCPLPFQGVIDHLRQAAHLAPIDFKATLPGRRGADADVSQGDVLCHGVVVVLRPGTAFDGPLSLRGLAAQVAQALTRQPRNVFFDVAASLLFDPPLDWVETAAGHDRNLRTGVRVSRSSTERVLGVGGTAFGRGVGATRAERPLLDGGRKLLLGRHMPFGMFSARCFPMPRPRGAQGHVTTLFDGVAEPAPTAAAPHSALPAETGIMAQLGQ